LNAYAPLAHRIRHTCTRKQALAKNPKQEDDEAERKEQDANVLQELGAACLLSQNACLDWDSPVDDRLRLSVQFHLVTSIATIQPSAA
jgi:hypothetical protein